MLLKKLLLRLKNSNNNKIFINSVINEYSNSNLIKIDIFIILPDNKKYCKIKEKITNSFKQYAFINVHTNLDFIKKSDAKEAIAKCDILACILIDNQVDQDVALAFAIAKKENIPLIIFYSSFSNEKISEIRLQSPNAFLRHVRSVDSLEIAVHNLIMNHFISRIKQNLVSTLGDNIVEDFDFSNDKFMNVATKKSLNLFKGSEDYLAKAFGSLVGGDEGDSERGECYEFGIKVMKWIIDNEPFPKEDIDQFVNSVNEINSSGWNQLRWNVIKHYEDNNLTMALHYAQEALECARQEEAPEWIIYDILIDCRNLDMEIGELAYYSEYQQQISSSDQIALLPSSDRFLLKSYEQSLDEEFKLDIKPLSALRLGGNFNSAMNDLQNYIFSAMIYGSYTHIFLSRKMIAKAIYKYAKTYNDDKLLYITFRLLVLSGDSDNLNKFIVKYWDNLYTYVNSNDIDEVWNLTNYTYRNKEITKFVLFKNYYAYFSEDKYEEVVFELKSISVDINNKLSDKLLESLLFSRSRIKDKYIVDIIISIMENDALRLGDKVSNLLLHISLENVNKDKIELLSKLLDRQLISILKHNGRPEFVANLIKQNPSQFLKLEEKIGDLTSITSYYYQLFKGEEIQYNELLILLIKNARYQFEANNNPSRRCGFTTEPLVNVCKILKYEFNATMIDTIISNFIPLCEEISESKYVMDYKVQCLNCLFEFIVNLKDIEYNLDFLRSIKLPDISETNDSAICMLETNNETTIALKTIMIKAILNIDVDDDIFKYYLSFESFSDLEKIALSECLMNSIKFNIRSEGKINEVLVPIVFALIDDRLDVVRANITVALSYLLQSRFKNVVENKLYEVILDRSPRVKHILLKQARCNVINRGTQLYKAILEALKDDPHFNIREQAREVLDN